MWKPVVSVFLELTGFTFAVFISQRKQIVPQKVTNIRIGPDRAYPLHFTHPQLLLLLPLLLKLGWNLALLVFWALSFEMITFQPLISFTFHSIMAEMSITEKKSGTKMSPPLELFHGV